MAIAAILASRSARIWRRATRRSTAPCGRDGATDAEVKRGLRYARPQTAQAPRLEVLAGGLLLTGVALALKIRPEKILRVTCMLIVVRRR